MANQLKFARSPYTTLFRSAATGIGTGSIAQLILEGKLTKPGVWSVEQALSTELFERSMQSRNLNINQEWL